MVYYPQQGMAGHTIIIGNEVFKGPARAELVEKFDEEPHNLKDLEGKGAAHSACYLRGQKIGFLRYDAYGRRRVGV